MVLKVRKLLTEHQKVVNEISHILIEGDFYLAGGTALFYYFKHRYSIDLDFFTFAKIDLRKFYKNFLPVQIKTISYDTIHLIIHNVNVSLFLYNYPLLKDFNYLDSIKLASLEDILCMKINAIILRGSKKDFIDVYFIMKKLKLKSRDVINLFVKKFGNYNELIIKKAITYFKDADNEPDIYIFKKIKWDTIKKFFVKTFATL
jgi:predicted nucleotidyltransferase component of viral defense system